MPSVAPKTLKNFLLYVDGVGYGGKIVEGTPPKLTIKTEEYGAGGLAAPIAIDTGVVEKLEFEATVGEYNPTLMSLLGVDNKGFTLRGAQAEGGESAEAVVYTMRGRMDEIDAGGWKHAQGKTECKIKFALVYLKVTIGGTTVVEIDPLGMIRAIGGTDQMASIRDALNL